MNNIGADEEDENNEVIPGQWRTDAVMHEVDAQLRAPRANAADQALRTTFQHYFNSDAGIVPFKMFSRWFFANNKIIITLRTSKVGDVT